MAGGRRWLTICGTAVCWGVFATSVAAEVYVYEAPDGSRLITDHPLSSKGYRLVRSGDTAKGMGRLVSANHTQYSRTDPSSYDRLIRRVADEHRVDFALIKAVMHVESAFNPYAKSSKGALGLMQLLPATALRYGISDIYDPAENVQAGVRHLSYLLKMFKHEYSLVLAAYNAGEHAVLRYRGIPPYRETQDYVKRVLQYKQKYGSAS